MSLRTRSWIRVLLAGITVLAALLAIALALLLWHIVGMPGQGREQDWRGDVRLPGIERRLETHVRRLARDIGPRHHSLPGALERTADYLADELSAMGHQAEDLRYGSAGAEHRILRLTLPGTAAGDILVVGAHYDSVPTSPGADDNASGLAVLLELARLLADRRFDRTLRLEFWPNEEQSLADMPVMGSTISADLSRQRGEAIIGMLSLEMLGYYSSEPGSQQYPPVIRNFYPERGDFLAFVGNFPSRPWLHEVLAAFRETRRFPSEGMAAPEWLVEDIRRSDHAAFWRAGYPALMLTDTANFRNPHYHRASDTPDTLDYAAMARLTLGLAETLESLATTPASPP